MKSELDLFEPHPIQSSILRTEEVSYNPIASIDNSSTIEFVCLGNGESYRDLSSVYLRLVIQLKDKDNKAITDNSVGVVNNILHSLFRSSSVYLNNVLVSHSDNNYHYRSYLQTLLNYGTDASETHLATSGWYSDNGHMDAFNNGLEKRKKLFQKSNKIELYGKVHGDIFNQNKLLLNNVDLKISFNLEKTAFYLIETDTESSLKILEAQLYMNHITVNPGILVAHHRVLQNKDAIYPYSRVEVKSFTLYPGNHSLSIDNVVIGQLPNFLAFCMVENKAYSGDRELNPFNFQHFHIQRFNLSVNGVQIPSQPLEFDYESTEKNDISSRAYNMLYKACGVKHFDRGLYLTKHFFDNGAFILAFDLTADNSNASMCANLIQQGTIRIEGRFSTPLKEAVTCLVYCEYDAMLNIDKNRNVRISL